MKISAIGQAPAPKLSQHTERIKDSQAASSAKPSAIVQVQEAQMKPIESLSQPYQKTPVEQDKETVQKSADRMNREPLLIDKKLGFKVHEATGKLFVEIKNLDNGEVIAEIPPKVLLDLEARLHSDAVPSLILSAKA